MGAYISIKELADRVLRCELGGKGILQAVDSVGARWRASPVRACRPRRGRLGRKSVKVFEIVGFGDFALEAFLGKIGGPFGNIDFFAFSTCPNFRGRFSRSAGGGQSSLYKGVWAFLGLRYRK